MFAVGALALANYTMMANNMAFRGMMANSTRLSMLSGLNGYDCNQNSLAALSAMDTQLEMDAFVSGIQYKYAQNMIEQLKKLQKDEIKRSFSIFA